MKVLRLKPDESFLNYGMRHRSSAWTPWAVRLEAVTSFPVVFLGEEHLMFNNCSHAHGSLTLKNCTRPPQAEEFSRILWANIKKILPLEWLRYRKWGWGRCAVVLRKGGVWVTLPVVWLIQLLFFLPLSLNISVCLCSGGLTLTLCW